MNCAVPLSGQRRLLLVEDSPVNQMIAQTMLKKAGYHVDTVANGLQALAAVESRAYDLVLMDLAMPMMDGFQATSRIRQLDGAVSRVPIVAVTANAVDEDRARCLAAGMNDYINKPIARSRLLAVLERWLPAGSGVPARAVPALDDDALRQLEADTDQVVLQRAIELFIGETAGRLQSIAKACERQDWQHLQREAHTLKGAAAMFGADRLQEHAKQLNNACKHRDWEQACTLVSNIALVAAPALEDLRRRYLS